MKTTLDLPDELIRAVKLRAVAQGRPLKDLVADLLTQALYAPKDQAKHYAAQEVSAPYFIDPQGLPIINGAANSPSSTATIQELLDIEQQALADQDSQIAI